MLAAQENSISKYVEIECSECVCITCTHEEPHYWLRKEDS